MAARARRWGECERLRHPAWVGRVDALDPADVRLLAPGVEAHPQEPVGECDPGRRRADARDLGRGRRVLGSIWATPRLSVTKIVVGEGAIQLAPLSVMRSRPGSRRRPGSGPAWRGRSTPRPIHRRAPSRRAVRDPRNGHGLAAHSLIRSMPPLTPLPDEAARDHGPHTCGCRDRDRRAQRLGRPGRHAA